MAFCVEQSHEDFCRSLMESINRPGQFPHHIHCQLTRVTPEGETVGMLEVVPENLNPWGTVHGGALAALADTVTGTGVIAATRCSCVTVSYSINYLRPGTGSRIICTSRPEKLGKNICVMHADLTNDKNELVATTEFTFCVLEPLDKETI